MGVNQNGAVLVAATILLLSAGGLLAFLAMNDSSAHQTQIVPTIEPDDKTQTQGDEVVVIDDGTWYQGKLSMTFSKSAGILKIYRDKELVKRIEAIAGGNTADKRQEGDKATPEGTFYICVKNPQSQYTRSLGISYPNVEDAERGLREAMITQEEFEHIRWAINRRVQPPWNTKLGGEIFIHGAKGNRTSTLGCISISDAEILEVFDHIPVGTPVTITP